MSIQPRIIQLDELELTRHVDLQYGDQCFYWRLFTASKGYTYGDTNPLIKNFRIPVIDVRRASYKRKAIEQIANELTQRVTTDAIYKDYTFIPVPTSNGYKQPDYDDRLLKTLERISALKQITMDIRELIIQPKAIQQAHTRQPKERLSIEQLRDIYEVQLHLIDPLPKKIIVFDDVLTKGSHFKAMEKILRKYYPNTPIVGLFIARSVYPLE